MVVRELDQRKLMTKIMMIDAATYGWPEAHWAGQARRRTASTARPSLSSTFHSVIVPTIYKEMFIIVATIYRLIFSTIFNNILKSITASRSFPLQERCSPQSSRRPDTRENFSYWFDIHFDIESKKYQYSIGKQNQTSSDTKKLTMPPISSGRPNL